jgi:hypothetical protein
MSRESNLDRIEITLGIESAHAANGSRRLLVGRYAAAVRAALANSISLMIQVLAIGFSYVSIFNLTKRLRHSLKKILINGGFESIEVTIHLSGSSSLKALPSRTIAAKTSSPVAQRHFQCSRGR